MAAAADACQPPPPPLYQKAPPPPPPLPPTSSLESDAKQLLPGSVEIKSDTALFFFRRRSSPSCLFAAAFAAFLLFLGLLILVLSLTVFKGRQPVINVEWVELRSLRVADVNVTELARRMEGLNLSAAALLEIGEAMNLTAMKVNLTLGVGVSVYNPNRASFRYTNSTSYLYYRQVEVGEAEVPAGRIGARGVEEINTTMALNVAAEDLLRDPIILSDIASGSLQLTATARVSGHINFLNVFRHRAWTSTYCTMSVSLTLRAVQDIVCKYHVRL